MRLTSRSRDWDRSARAFIEGEASTEGVGIGGDGGQGPRRDGPRPLVVEHRRRDAPAAPARLPVPVTAPDSLGRPMRILTVSAHYPPNFVSGGHPAAPAAVPGRCAARGHDVSVYAGWIGERRPAGDLDGRRRHRPPGALGGQLAVDRLVRRAQLAQPGGHRRLPGPPGRGAPRRRALPRPAVARGRAAWRRPRRPAPAWSSPCTTSGGCAPASSWWTATSSPCCLVVEAGVCPCEVDAAWRHQRGDGPGRPAGLGRPRAGPLGRRLAACSWPTAWRPGAWPSTRTACPTSTSRDLGAAAPGPTPPAPTARRRAPRSTPGGRTP